MGVLLAGGAATRFGGAPKGLSRIDGARIADRLLTALRATCDRVLVVANDPAANAWFPGERIVGDAVTGLGPLNGLLSSLLAGDGDPVLVVAWDMPFVTSRLLRHLRAAGERWGGSVVPAHGDDPVIEPLCAYYAADAAATAHALVTRGERRASALAHSLLAHGRATRFGDDELAPFGDVRRLFASVDTLERLRALGGDAPDDRDPA